MQPGPEPADSLSTCQQTNNEIKAMKKLGLMEFLNTLFI